MALPSRRDALRYLAASAALEMLGGRGNVLARGRFRQTVAVPPRSIPGGVTMEGKPLAGAASDNHNGKVEKERTPRRRAKSRSASALRSA